MTLDLQPGTYVAVYHLPDPPTGVVYLHLGCSSASPSRDDVIPSGAG